MDELISSKEFKRLTDNREFMKKSRLNKAKQIVLEAIDSAITGSKNVGEVDDEKSVSLYYEENNEIIVGTTNIKELLFSSKFPMEMFKEWLKSSGWELYIYEDTELVIIDIVTTE